MPRETILDLGFFEILPAKLTSPGLFDYNKLKPSVIVGCVVVVKAICLD